MQESWWHRVRRRQTDFTRELHIWLQHCGFGLSFKSKFSHTASFHTAACRRAGAAMRRISVLAVNTQALGLLLAQLLLPCTMVTTHRGCQMTGMSGPLGAVGCPQHGSFLNAGISTIRMPSLLPNPSTNQSQTLNPTPRSSHEELQNQTHPRSLSPYDGARHREAWDSFPIPSQTLLATSTAGTTAGGSRQGCPVPPRLWHIPKNEESAT